MTEIAKQIWHILQCSIKPMGLFFEPGSIKVIPNGTSFRVNTIFIVGLVEITKLSLDSYTVSIQPDNYGSPLIYKDITSDNLVNQIDQVVKEGILVDNRKSIEYRRAV